MNSRQGRSIPELRTEHVRLVGLEHRHFSAFRELHADPETMQYIGDGKPLDAVGAWLHMAMLLGHWELRGYGVWAVEERDTGQFIGRAGLFQPEGWPYTELGWIIHPAMQRRGLAVDVAQTALEFALEAIGTERLVSLIRPGNAASISVAEKLGASLSETIDFMGSPMQVYRYTQLA